MYNKAVAVSKSTIPVDLKNKEGIKKAVTDLVKGTEELDVLVKAKATDAAITTKLASLHDIFHKKWKPVIKKMSKQHYCINKYVKISSRYIMAEFLCC